MSQATRLQLRDDILQIIKNNIADHENDWNQPGSIAYQNIIDRIQHALAGDLTLQDTWDALKGMAAGIVAGTIVGVVGGVLCPDTGGAGCAAAVAGISGAVSGVVSQCVDNCNNPGALGLAAVYGAATGLFAYGIGGAGSYDPCGANSFAPQTKVLLADGKIADIKDLRVGEEVKAADPKSGHYVGARPVLATMVHHDNNLVDLTVNLGHGRQVVLHTTTEHPFWDSTIRAWVAAAQLVVGHSLATIHGAAPTVVRVTTTAGAADRYNLTIEQLHTFYVMAGNTPVLVHNACGDYENPGHHDPYGGPNPYNPKKAVLPADAELMFYSSMDVEGVRWTKIGNGKKAVYYRYFSDGNGNWHWSGSSVGVTLSGKPVNIPLDDIPISVRRSQGV